MSIRFFRVIEPCPVAHVSRQLDEKPSEQLLHTSGTVDNLQHDEQESRPLLHGKRTRRDYFILRQFLLARRLRTLDTFPVVKCNVIGVFNLGKYVSL
jgi:hypothetical protein